MSEPTTTATTTSATSPLDLDDSSSWHREGPVRLLQGGQWRRKNGPVACELCRRRRVRCSGFETGAPCLSCIRRNERCVIGDDTYTPDTPPTTVFAPILPPPPAPCASPSSCSTAPPLLDLDAIDSALATPIPRPAPLVWRATDDSLQPNGLSTRGLRQKRSAPSYVEDEPEPPVVAPRLLLKKRAPSPPVDETAPILDEHLEHLETTPRPSSKPKRVHRTSPSRPVQVKLRRHVPESPASHNSPSVQLAVFCSRTRTLVRLEALKAGPPRSVELELVQRAPFSHPLPLSSARDEPVAVRRSPLARPSCSSPDSHLLLATSTRRDSLGSASSLASDGSALFERAAVGERRGSTATSASSVEGGVGGREGGVTAWCSET
ncbi:hypothetical protein JCM8208_007388 [Rhodotorula glutinis]